MSSFETRARGLAAREDLRESAGDIAKVNRMAQPKGRFGRRAGIWHAEQLRGLAQKGHLGASTTAAHAAANRAYQQQEAFKYSRQRAEKADTRQAMLDERNESRYQDSLKMSKLKNRKAIRATRAGRAMKPTEVLKLRGGSTPESWETYRKSGDPRDLVPREVVGKKRAFPAQLATATRGAIATAQKNLPTLLANVRNAQDAVGIVNKIFPFFTSDDERVEAEKAILEKNMELINALMIEHNKLLVSGSEGEGQPAQAGAGQPQGAPGAQARRTAAPQVPGRQAIQPGRAAPAPTRTVRPRPPRLTPEQIMDGDPVKGVDPQFHGSPEQLDAALRGLDQMTDEDIAAGHAAARERDYREPAPAEAMPIRPQITGMVPGRDYGESTRGPYTTPEIEEKIRQRYAAIDKEFMPYIEETTTPAQYLDVAKESLSTALSTLPKRKQALPAAAEVPPQPDFNQVTYAGETPETPLEPSEAMKTMYIGDKAYQVPESLSPHRVKAWLGDQRRTAGREWQAQQAQEQAQAQQQAMPEPSAQPGQPPAPATPATPATKPGARPMQTSQAQATDLIAAMNRPKDQDDMIESRGEIKIMLDNFDAPGNQEKLLEVLKGYKKLSTAEIMVYPYRGTSTAHGKDRLTAKQAERNAVISIAEDPRLNWNQGVNAPGKDVAKKHYDEIYGFGAFDKRFDEVLINKNIAMFRRAGKVLLEDLEEKFLTSKSSNIQRKRSLAKQKTEREQKQKLAKQKKDHETLMDELRDLNNR